METKPNDGPTHTCPCGAAYYSKDVADACRMSHVVDRFDTAFDQRTA